MDKKDGGPAFPVSSYVNAMGQTFDSSVQGMTLRDYFAGKCLEKIGSFPETIKLNWLGNEMREEQRKYFDQYIAAAAQLSYEMADAMLKERDR